MYCLLLNKNEDELYSGSEDHSIKIWKIDQNSNQLFYIYSLENGHTRTVYSMSIN